MAVQVAASLADLMTRLERKRSYYQIQQDYVRLFAIGGLFVLFAFVLNSGVNPFVVAAIILVGSPYMLGFYKLANFRLNEERLRQALPFFWGQHDGDWVFELHAANFPLAEFNQLQFFPTVPSFANVVRGRVNHVPVLVADLATVSLKAKGTRKSIYTGFVMRFAPLDDVATFATRLQELQVGQVKVQGQHVWLLQETAPIRYGKISLKDPLNDMVTYEKIEAEIRQMAELTMQATAAA